MKKYLFGIQIFIILFIFSFLTITPFLFLPENFDFFLIIYGIYYFLNLIFLIDVYRNKRSDRQSKISWTVILLLPLPMFFFYILSAKLFFYQKKIITKSLPLENVENTEINIFQEKIDILVTGTEKFTDLIHELEHAKESIDIEYFIINNGIIWNKIKTILLNKAEENVKIRILTDYMGNIQTNDSSYKELRNHKNISFVIFNKVNPLFSTGFDNLRNHNKVVIIDNNIAYFGGLNLGDDYAHMYSKYGYWYDLHYKTFGALTLEIKKKFLFDWNRFSNESFSLENEEEKLLKKKKTLKVNSDIKPYEINFISDGYDQQNPNFLLTFIHEVDNAKETIKIISPYLVFPKNLMDAFKRAIKRGVKIEIITTGIADKKTAYFVSHYYANELIDNGIVVYRANNFFVHGKQYIFDNKNIIIGTSNLDYRALFLHFEYNFLIKKNQSFIDENLIRVWEPLLKYSLIEAKTNHKRLRFLIKFISPIF